MTKIKVTKVAEGCYQDWFTEGNIYSVTSERENHWYVVDDEGDNNPIWKDGTRGVAAVVVAKEGTEDMTFNVGDKIRWKFKTEEWDFKNDHYHQKVYTVRTDGKAYDEDGNYLRLTEAGCDYLLVSEAESEEITAENTQEEPNEVLYIIYNTAEVDVPEVYTDSTKAIKRMAEDPDLAVTIYAR